MRKKLLYLTVCATILLFGACNNEEPLPEVVRTVSLTASMPESEPTTRVDLNQNGKNIELTWKVGDVIELVFVQGPAGAGQKIEKKTATVGSTTNAGKTAHFNIPLPGTITTGTFDLYGVYGGNGLSPTNYTHAILPGNPGLATSLNTGATSVQDRKDVMLYFASRGIVLADLQVSVTFKHLGSIFGVSFNNVPLNVASVLTPLNITSVQLVGVNNTGNMHWAYNSEACGQSFDLVTETFLDLSTGNNYISFSPSSLIISPNGILTLWGWYPMPGIVWPELKLEVKNAGGTTLMTTINTKAAKLTAPIGGKTYHFYIKHNGQALPNTKFNFANDQYVVTP